VRQGDDDARGVIGMAYEYAKRVDDVYMIDTRMFGFDCFQSSYIVAGKQVALIDTGVPTSLETVCAAIKEHGFAIEDISYIFVTHCEHPDHSGNVGMLLKENPEAKVYINPIGAEYLTDPSIEAAKRKVNLSAQMAARFGEMVPVPPSRIEHLSDGDTFDLGNGERLKIIFAPGHQPSGIVILEEKNMGLFINDLVGLYLADADASLIFTPFRSDVKQAMASLRKVMDIPVTKLFLGHFGICDKPTGVMQRALSGMQRLLNIGGTCLKEGKPKEIASRVLASRMPEIEKIRVKRGESLYAYMNQELVPSLSTAFASYYLGLYKNLPN
jgi:glyoxylase-like metal-dependent hydrolase (beta-lactamase superfamily II)